MNWERTGIGLSGSPAALAALQAQIVANPSDLIALHNLAVEHRLLGQPAEALAAAEAAWNAGLHVPETATVRGHCLVELGQLDDAVAWFRTALARDPAHVSAHEALAALLPQLGAAEHALDSFADALKLRPGDIPLWTAALATANAQHSYAQLEEWSQTALARFGADPVLSGYLACAEVGLGRRVQARETIAEALAREPGYATGHLIHARILLALGDARAAVQAATEASRLAPTEQLGWTLLSTAWRLLEDPREHWLCRYDDYVMLIDIDLPDGIEDALSARHRAASNPAEQSLRNGTQTPGHLFHTADTTILELAWRIHAAIEARLSTLERADDHPFLARNTGAVTFSTAWSVQLRSHGFHVGHMHPAGWLSSALYVALPDVVSSGTGAGVLTFGVPDAALGFDLSPRRIVQPQVGQLVLFPSYLWHATTPFQSNQPRLTVAFDALPAAPQMRGA